MKSGLVITTGLLALFAFATSARSVPQQPVPQQPAENAHCVWLAERIREAETIKIGMTRREVMKILQEDQGGEESFVQRTSFRYQRPACEYIKLDVFYKLAKDSKTRVNYLDDTVIKVSQPFLDLVSNKVRF